MKPHHYLAIIVRLFAICLFIYGIKFIPTIFNLILLDSFSIVKKDFTPVIVIIIISYLLWKFPITISKLIINPEIDQEIKPMGTQKLLSVLIITLGLFTLYYGVVDTAYWILYQKFMSDIPNNDQAANTIAMITTGVELVVSFILIAKAKTIAYYLLKFQGQ
jgi:hypothetical protein